VLAKTLYIGRNVGTGDVMSKVFLQHHLVAAATGALAQQPAAIRVVGAVENFDGHVHG
jgi:hypothetical protein